MLEDHHLQVVHLNPLGDSAIVRLGYYDEGRELQHLLITTATERLGLIAELQAFLQKSYFSGARQVSNSAQGIAYLMIPNPNRHPEFPHFCFNYRGITLIELATLLYALRRADQAYRDRQGFEVVPVAAAAAAAAEAPVSAQIRPEVDRLFAFARVLGREGEQRERALIEFRARIEEVRARRALNALFPPPYSNINPDLPPAYSPPPSYSDYADVDGEAIVAPPPTPISPYSPTVFLAAASADRSASSSISESYSF